MMVGSARLGSFSFYFVVNFGLQYTNVVPCQWIQISVFGLGVKRFVVEFEIIIRK